MVSCTLSVTLLSLMCVCVCVCVCGVCVCVCVCVCVAAVGLDAAGKTTLLYRLKLAEVVTTIPAAAHKHNCCESTGKLERKVQMTNQ